MIPGLWTALMAGVVAGQAMYAKDSPVMQVNSHNFNKLISKSTQVSWSNRLTRFYAPWCGHCKSLKPQYEKAAKSLRDLAQVAAIDCDQDDNKSFCGSQGVKGFPTLKIVRPSKTPGSPHFEDYQGPREAQGIVDAVKAAIPNKVKRIGDKTLDSWLETDNSTAKAILFSDKGLTGAFIRVVANEFIGTLNFAQIRNTEKKAGEMFAVAKYPTFFVLPGGTQDAVQYEGAFVKKDLLDFLTQYAARSDGRSIKDKVKEKVKSAVGKDSPKSADKKSFEKASASYQSSQASSAAASATDETIVDQTPLASPGPIVDDGLPKAEKGQEFIKLAPRIPFLQSQSELENACLGERSSTCVLTLLPADHKEPVPGELFDVKGTLASTALDSFANVAQAYKDRGTPLFPLYAIPATNEIMSTLRSALGVEMGLELVALNGRRAWFRRFEGDKYDLEAIDTWIGNLRLGEGAKKPLPESLLVKAESTEEPAPAQPGHDEL